VASGVPWQVTTEGLVIAVRLTPKGGRDAIDGVEQMADGRTVLKVRVRAAPSEGEANAALVRLMAKSLAVAARQVSLVAGATARIKRLEVAGPGPALAATLAGIVEASRS
jgi:uncharacterized protein (TIGR00251 family)